jgi:hypothetical protein
MFFLHPALTLFHELMHDTRGPHERVTQKHRTVLSGKWKFDSSIEAQRRGPEMLACGELEALVRSVVAREQTVAPALPWREASALHEAVIWTLGRMRNLRGDRGAVRPKEDDELIGRLLREEYERCVARRQASRAQKERRG